MCLLCCAGPAVRQLDIDIDILELNISIIHTRVREYSSMYYLNFKPAPRPGPARVEQGPKNC